MSTTQAPPRAVATFPKIKSLNEPTPLPDFKSARISISPEFCHLVASTSVQEAFPSHTVYYAKSNDSISYVFFQLIQHKIMAIPIMDEHSGKWVAWIDIMDILHYVVTRLGYPESNIGSQLESWVTQSEFASLPCSVLYSQAKRNPWVSVHQTDSVQQLIHAMGGWNNHRVAIVDSKNYLTGVVSMSKVCRWLQGQNMGNLGRMTLKQLNLGFKNVLSVRQNQIAMEAFVLIARNPVGGVAVLDDDDQVIGNISANDFKEIGWAAQMFVKLYLTCRQFIELRFYGANRPKVISVPPTATISQVINTINQWKVHRVYIVDETAGGEKVLQGVVALGDILQLLDYGLKNH